MPSVANTSAGAASSFSIRKRRRSAGIAEINREEDGMTAPPSFQRRLEEPDQILRFLFDLDLTVAQQPKNALRDDGKTREQMIEKERDHLLDRQKPDLAARQPNKAIDRGSKSGSTPEGEYCR